MLRLATEPEKRARDRLTAQAWGERLTVDQFCERELALRGHAWARTAMQTWFWVDAAGQLLSSCETFETPSSVGPRIGRSWGIASVFTEERLRGHGYATQMFAALTAHLRALPGAQAAVLYSDVGARIYERSGFVALPADDVEWPAMTVAHESVEWSAQAQAIDCAAAEGALVLHAGDGQFDWQVERERVYARLLQRSALPWHQVRLGRSVMSFAASLKVDELVVLHAHVETVHAQRQLIAALQTLAAAHQLKTIRAWPESLMGDPELRRVPRDGSLPMVAPFVEGADRWQCIHRGLWL